MISVSDLLKILDKLKIWKELKALPAKVAELEARISTLENSKKTNNDAEFCPKCRANTMEFISSEPDPIFGECGLYNRTYKCPTCGTSEITQINKAKM